MKEIKDKEIEQINGGAKTEDVVNDILIPYGSRTSYLEVDSPAIGVKIDKTDDNMLRFGL